MAISEGLIEETLLQLMRKASISLPLDVQNALRAGYAREESAVAKGQLMSILDNCRIANEKQIGLCQDTGVPMVYADVGLNCHMEGNPQAAMTRALKRATAEVPLRQNVINPLTNKIPAQIPDGEFPTFTGTWCPVRIAWTLWLSQRGSAPKCGRPSAGF